MSLTGFWPAAQRLAMPPRVFVAAVRLAAVPRAPLADPEAEAGVRCAAIQPRYAAVDHLVTWWNDTAPAELRGAFSFTPYVKVHQGWASGDREEGYVSDAVMARATRPGGGAALGVWILIEFCRKPVSNGHWFSAPSVDGGHGVEGGLPDGLSAEASLAADAYDALHEFPSRFGDLWDTLQQCT